MTALKIFKDSYHVPASPFSLFSRPDKSSLFMCSPYIEPSSLIISGLCSECAPFVCLQQAGDDLPDVRQFATMFFYIRPIPKYNSTNSEFGNRFWVNLVMFSVLAFEIDTKKKEGRKGREGVREGD